MFELTNTPTEETLASPGVLFTLYTCRVIPIPKHVVLIHNLVTFEPYHNGVDLFPFVVGSTSAFIVSLLACSVDPALTFASDEFSEDVMVRSIAPGQLIS